MALVDGATRQYGGATNTVYLKNIQTKESWNGKFYLGSKFENLSPSTDYALFEPFEFEGKTYAVFYSHNGGTAQKITDAQAFAASAGGTVMTVSSKAEMVAVNNYYYGVWTQPSSYFQERYDVCKPTSAGETFCKGEIFNERYLVGLIRQSDDSFRWDGDDAGYGDTFLASQYYWDKQQFRLDRGEEVQSYEVDHEIKSDILILRSQ